MLAKIDQGLTKSDTKTAKKLQQIGLRLTKNQFGINLFLRNVNLDEIDLKI